MKSCVSVPRPPDQAEQECVADESVRRIVVLQRFTDLGNSSYKYKVEKQLTPTRPSSCGFLKQPGLRKKFADLHDQKESSTALVFIPSVGNQYHRVSL